MSLGFNRGDKYVKNNLPQFAYVPLAYIFPFHKPLSTSRQTLSLLLTCNFFAVLKTQLCSTLVTLDQNFRRYPFRCRSFITHSWLAKRNILTSLLTHVKKQNNASDFSKALGAIKEVRWYVCVLSV